MPNLKTTCRCCLAESKVESELYEFSSEVSVESDTANDPQNFVKISECYRQLTSITVPEEAEDSSKICSQCLGDLKFCFMFQQKCWDSDKIYSEDTQNEEVFTIEQVDADIKAEHETNIIDYVEEEYIDDMNDEEATNDGFENEDGIVRTEDEDELLFEQPKLKKENEKKTKVTSSPAKSVSDHKDKYRRSFRRSHLSSVTEDEDPSKDDTKSYDTLRQCNFCSKISMTLQEHESHMMNHDGDLQYNCKKCDEKFPTKEKARDHLNSVHSNDDKTFNCTQCFKTFKNRYQLILHTRSHTGEKPFPCPICNRCFSMSSNLQKHLDTHSTEKPYKCNQCDSNFKTQRSLKFHTVCYHQPEAKVKCPNCEKTFVNKSYLKMHMLYHTGEKNFTCTICNSKYYKSSHLKRHIQNVHFKLRLMKCDYCTSDFVRKETYRAHITSHHKRHLSDEDYNNVLEKIKKFQPPSLDIKQFTLEKQVQEVDMEDENEGNVGVIEIIGGEEEADDAMEMDGEGEYFDSELYEDEQ